MNDGVTTVQVLKDTAEKFVHERDWHQFHTLKNLSMDVSIEAAELMEHFLWAKDEDLETVLQKNRATIEDEAADVLFGLLQFCTMANIDLAQAFAKKLEKTAQRYPVEKSKGKNLKYTEL